MLVIATLIHAHVIFSLIIKTKNPIRRIINFLLLKLTSSFSICNNNKKSYLFNQMNTINMLCKH
jgi:hypothetical protein